MDPVTQSTQISSSQGLGQNSAAKESKQSDKRVKLGSDKPCEGVETSPFHSQPATFTSGNSGSEAGPLDGQPESPVKMSPVSERIKTLEALAAKQKEPDFRSDRGFSQFRDHEKSRSKTPKSSVPKTTPTIQKRRGSADQESPESPFEILGDLKQGNQYEETEEWMKAHLPPVLEYDLEDLKIKHNPMPRNSAEEEKETCILIPDAPATFSGDPIAIMDSPVEAPALNKDFRAIQNHPSVEEQSEFDLSFLPTAYMCEQEEESGIQTTSNLNLSLAESPEPPAVFCSQSPIFPSGGMDENQSDDKRPCCLNDPDHTEASEVDSSESDDTVIEDDVSVPPSTSYETILSDSTSTASAAPDFPTEERGIPPPKSERKLMQVPTINVIESDQQNYSEEEMELEGEIDEDYDVVKDLAKEAVKTPEQESEDSKNEPCKRRPVETEFMEGYSPPSSPQDSGGEYSPEHKISSSPPETVQESPSKTTAQPKETDLNGLACNCSEAESEKLQLSASVVIDEPYPPIVTHEDVDFPNNGNDSECSDGAHNFQVEPCKTDLVLMEPTTDSQSKENEKSNTPVKEVCVEGTSLPLKHYMQDDIYGRESLDLDSDSCPPSDDSDTGLKSLLADLDKSTPKKVSEDHENQEDFNSLNDARSLSMPVPESPLRNEQNSCSSVQSETQEYITEQDKITERGNITGQHLNEKITMDIVKDDMKNDNILHMTDPDLSVHDPTDSFVEFMQECLKLREDEERDYADQGVPSKKELCEMGLPPCQATPSMLMDLEQEQLTIKALKELDSCQDEDGHDKVIPNESIEQSLFTSTPNAPCSQSSCIYDSACFKEVETIDEWMAEAYHLAEHVLTAILTYMSVRDLIHWRDPKKSGVVFGLSMLLLLSLAAFSVITVVSYLLLALLCVTITFRIYKSVVQAVQKSSDGHPFKTLIEKDVGIPPETFRKHVDTSLTYINRALKQMSRLFLVEDLVDSLKLAVVMWLFTYVGAVFNGITILILADILLFSVPPIYEKNKTQVDQYVDLIRTQVNNTMAKLQEKLPGAVKRSKTE